MEFKKIEIDRLIIHKIIGKKDVAAHSIPAKALHVLDKETNGTLLSRIFDAVGKSKRFFETAVEKTEDGTFWHISKDLKGCDEKEFIKRTSAITDLAVDAHQNKTRPGGLLIIMEGRIDGFISIIVIKAELQEALTLNGNAVELIKELFLSPAKEFYKIGLLIHSKPTKTAEDGYECYIYDDNFTPKKADLATYFYRDFLGFSTSENDKLTTNNFLTSFLNFVDTNVKDFQSRKNIKIRIKADYRESSNGIIDPTSYVEFFQDDEELNKKFADKILKKFPKSFSKDLTLVDSSLQKSSLQITSDLQISGPSDLVDNLEVFDLKEDNGRKRLITQLDSGNVAKVVTLKNEAIRPSLYNTQ
jgi:hypothetical protein